MSRERPSPGVPVPTLTEVIGAGAPAAPAGELQHRAVLARVEARVATLFEQRLREALAASVPPAVERAIEQTRAEAGAALHEWVAEAVAQELHRQRGA